MPTPEIARGLLVNELGRIRQRGIARIGRNPDGLPTLRLPVLTQCCELLAADASDDLRIRIAQLLRRATDRMPHEPAECVLAEFGLDDHGPLGRDAFPPGRPEDYLDQFHAKYLPQYYDESGKLRASRRGTATRVSRTVRSEARAALATAILELADWARDEPAARRIGGAEETWILRPRLDTALRDAIASSSAVVWLHGEPGTGKTTLARSAVTDRNTFVYIDASTAERLHDTIALALDRYGRSTAHHPAILRARFVDLLVTEGGPHTVLLDNYDETQFPELFESPERLHAKLVVTSRRLPPDSPHVRAVCVEGFEPREAAGLVSALLPDASPQMRDRLAERLFHRPLLLNQAARTVKRYDMDVETYLQALNEPDSYVREVAAGASDRQSDITHVYRTVLDRLAAEPPTRLAVLDLVLALGSTIRLRSFYLLWSLIKPPADVQADRPNVIQRPGSDALAHAIAIQAKLIIPIPPLAFPALAQAEVDQSLVLLRELGIVRVVDGALVVHPLTTIVARQLRGTAVTAAEDAVLSAVVRGARRWYWTAGSPLPEELLRMVAPCMPSIMRSIERAAGNPDRIDEAQRCLAIMIRGIGQGLLRPLPTRLIQALLTSDRRLFVPEGQELDPVRSSNESPGYQALWTEFLAVNAHVRTNDVLSDRMGAFLRTRGATHVPDPGTARLDAGGTETAVHTAVDGVDVSQLGNAAYERQSAGDGCKETLPVDQVQLYRWGRWLASRGNIEQAIRVLTFNANSVTRIAASIASTACALDSLRVAADGALRAGQAARCEELLSEMDEVAAKRSEIVINGERRFQVLDMALDVRIGLLRSEVALVRLMMSDSGTEDLVIQAAREALARYVGIQGIPNVGLRFEAFEHYLRVNNLAMICDPNAGTDDDDVRRYLSLVDREMAAGIRRAEPLHRLILVTPALVMAVAMEAVQSGQGVELLISGAGSADLPQTMALLGDPTAGMREQEMQRLFGSVDRIVAYLDSATREFIEAESWYHAAKVATLTACAAQLPEVQEANISAFVDRGILLSQQAGRDDWAKLIRNARGGLHEVLWLLLR